MLQSMTLMNNDFVFENAATVARRVLDSQTGYPASVETLAKLSALVEDEAAEICVANQVIAQAYIAVQHHFGVFRNDARAGLFEVLRSGLVAPLNGEAVLAALEAFGGAGLYDRMAALRDVWRLHEIPGHQP